MLERYSRNILLREVGIKGQRKLLRSRVLVVGAGGLGSPAGLYLAAAGVGTIGVVDSDVVELSNLQRQILHRTSGVGKSKAESARESLTALNPEVEVVAYPLRLGASNVFEIIEDYDVVIDGVDNFPARYLLNDACYFSRKPLVEAGILGFDGMVMTIKPGVGPCYRCVFPEPPPPGAVPACAEAGVLGALAGVIGAVQAVEALKLLLDIGHTYTGRILVYHGLDGGFREVSWAPNPSCPLCGKDPVIRELKEYRLACDPGGRGVYAYD